MRDMDVEPNAWRVWWLRKQFDGDVKIWISYVYVWTSCSLHVISLASFVKSGTLHSSHTVVNWFHNLSRGLVSCYFDMSGWQWYWIHGSVAYSFPHCLHLWFAFGWSFRVHKYKQHLGLQRYNKWFANIAAWMRVSLVIFVCRCLLIESQKMFCIWTRPRVFLQSSDFTIVAGVHNASNILQRYNKTE